MKTYKNLWPQVCSFENLYIAWRKARRGKLRRIQVIAFERELEENLLGLRDELEAGTYEPGPHVNFYVYDGKRRKISAAAEEQRVPLPAVGPFRGLGRDGCSPLPPRS